MKVRLLNVICAAFTCLSLFAQETIKIGLLFQEKNQKAALQAAELAVNTINLKGGVNGQRIELVYRSMEGPWGMGSKQAVDLIWNDKVCALIASCDGRNAHLVEQASAKSIMPLISAWSSDPTLSHAFIPWFYNCVPNDEQQGIAIAQEIFEVRNLKKPVIITDQNYDSQKALAGYRRYTDDKNYPSSSIISYEKSEITDDELIQRLNSATADCIILMASPKTASTVIQLLKLKKPNLPVFGSIQILNENILLETEYNKLKNNIAFACMGNFKMEYENFALLYKQKYKVNPGMVAAFAYDAMNVIIQAIEKSGSTDNEDISKALSSLKYRGVTGIIQFAEWGIRQDSCSFRKTAN